MALTRTAQQNLGFPGDSGVKNSPANAGDAGFNSGSGRTPGEGNGNPLQYSCLGNPTGEECLQTTAHGETDHNQILGAGCHCLRLD